MRLGVTNDDISFKLNDLYNIKIDTPNMMEAS